MSLSLILFLITILVLFFLFIVGSFSGVVLAKASLDIAFHVVSNAAVFALYSAWYFLIQQKICLKIL